MAIVLDTSLLSIGDVVGAVVDAFDRQPPRCGATSVLAVDGGAGAGKSTLAALVAAAIPGAAVLHTDLLLAGWDDQFTFWPKLQSALDSVALGRPATFPGFDWIREVPAGTVRVPVTAALVVEGVSAIAACGERASLRVFRDLPRPVRERRWVQRDRMPVQPLWRTWLDREDAFFAAHPPTADVIVRGL